MKELYNGWSTSSQNMGRARAGSDQSNPPGTAGSPEARDTGTSPEKDTHPGGKRSQDPPELSQNPSPAPPLHPPAPLPRRSAGKRRGNAPPAWQGARSPRPAGLTRSSSMSAGTARHSAAGTARSGGAGRGRGAGMRSRSGDALPVPPLPRDKRARRPAPRAPGLRAPARPPRPPRPRVRDPAPAGECSVGQRWSVRPETASIIIIISNILTYFQTRFGGARWLYQNFHLNFSTEGGRC